MPQKGTVRGISVGLIGFARVDDGVSIGGVKLEWHPRALTSGRDGVGSTVVDTDDDPRDLTFRPADPSSAKVLTASQLDAYNRDGFLTPIDVFDAKKTAENSSYIEDLVEKVVSAPDRRNAYSIMNYHMVCRGLYDLIVTPRILDCVEDILGPDFVCWNSQLFFKAPRDPMAVSLHQDAAYWPLTPAHSVTVWLAIDDADAGNAAVEYLTGTHLLGAVEHADRELDGTRTLKREAVVDVSSWPRQTNVLQAGQMSFHSDLILHESPPNLSDRRRAGLSLEYAAADVRPLAGAEWYIDSAVHCRGSLPPHWPHRRRPSSEHPEILAHLAGDFDGVPEVR